MTFDEIPKPPAVTEKNIEYHELQIKSEIISHG
jgi:hypothetical protein